MRLNNYLHWSVAAFLLALSSWAAAEKYTGNYTLRAPNGTVLNLSLSEEKGGRTTGTLTGNGAVIQLEGSLQQGSVIGLAIAGQNKAVFQAVLNDPNQLTFILADVGPNGTPNLAAAQRLNFTRTNAAATAPQGSANAPHAQAAPQGGGSPQDQQLRQLLLSSPWCSFSYNKNSGATNTSRNVFYTDGRLALNTNYEGGTVNQRGGSSVDIGGGATGSIASQSQGGGVVRWMVQGGMLYLDGGQGMQPVQMNITRNSNGYPIITADGKEYTQCR
jgi:hypothetical protein